MIFVQVILETVQDVLTTLNAVFVTKLHIVIKLRILKASVSVKLNILKISKKTAFIAQLQGVQTVQRRMYVKNVIRNKDSTKQ